MVDHGFHKLGRKSFPKQQSLNCTGDLKSAIQFEIDDSTPEFLFKNSDALQTLKTMIYLFFANSSWLGILSQKVTKQKSLKNQNAAQARDVCRIRHIGLKLILLASS